MTEQIIARFTFKPDRAQEFLFDEGQLVSELQVDSIDEVMDYVLQFDDALTDASAIVNGQVVSLTDFPAVSSDEEEL
jgi:hypothetical protein